jgi:PncC family amidohydrolase
MAYFLFSSLLCFYFFHTNLTNMTPVINYTPRSTETAYQIACEVIHLLKESGETLAVSESLTGGGLMGTITSVEGCSSVFRGGVVSYATPIKQHLLQVDGDLIAEHGVIHADVAAQMAIGARTITTQHDMTPTSWGIGTTGVAGPDSQDGKPVGMVFIGIASSRGGKRFGPFHFPGSPERVREATIIEALNLLRQEVVKARQGVSL